MEFKNIHNLPMTNFFTPNEFQDLKKQKAPKQSTLSDMKPSVFTLNVIMGYSAALQVLKSKKFGDLGILNN